MITIASFVVGLTLLIALVVTHNAYAEANVTISQQQTEISKTKSQLSETQKAKTQLEEQQKSDTAQLQQLEKENADLKAKRQAKLDAEAKAQQEAQQAKSVIASVPVVGNCASWLANAGVTDISSAITLIDRESGCNPNAVNPSSGACGVGQELPCGKSGCNLGDGACQVAWMNRYVLGRYGSWASALAHSNSLGWY